MGKECISLTVSCQRGGVSNKDGPYTGPIFLNHFTPLPPRAMAILRQLVRWDLLMGNYRLASVTYSLSTRDKYNDEHHHDSVNMVKITF